MKIRKAWNTEEDRKTEDQGSRRKAKVNGTGSTRVGTEKQRY